MLEESLLASKLESILTRESGLVFDAINQKALEEIILGVIPDEETFDKRRIVPIKDIEFDHVKQGLGFAHFTLGSNFSPGIIIYTKEIGLYAAEHAQYQSKFIYFSE